MNARLKTVFVDLILLFLICCGVLFRFYNMNWDSGALLHPDEYGLTNTLTQLSIPASLGNYFNTRESTLSPYDKYDLEGAQTENGPDNRMRWGQLPILIIRLTAEALNQTGYTHMRRVGRYLSALADVGTLVLLFFIARRLLHNRTAALLAAALNALAVMPIQQSHFMSSDNFAVFFIMLTLHAAVRISQREIIQRRENGSLAVAQQAWKWFALLGVFTGMAMACKINQAVVGGMVVFAIFIAVSDFKLTARRDFSQVFTHGLLLCLFSAAAALLTFRLLQPMSFRAPSGNTTLFTLHFNKDWIDSMLVSAAESSGNGGSPPAEQWAHRIPVVFPLVNMVLYGMGLPLGIAAWISALAALWTVIRLKKGRWQALMIPAVWAVAYFLFMGTRFVKSIRYMLPVYPMLCLLAAWGLCNLWQRAQGAKGAKKILPALAALLVLGGTALWAGVFVKTIYGQVHSRVEAVTWMYQNIPAMIQLQAVSDTAGTIEPIPISAPNPLTLTTAVPFQGDFRAKANALADKVMLPHVTTLAETGEPSRLRVRLLDEDGAMLSEAEVEIPTPSRDVALEIPVPSAVLLPGSRYTLQLELLQGAGITLRRSVLANENWDEGLPFPLYGFDPFGQQYNGMTNEIRWSDNENKKEMLLNVLEKADYIILPSQRSLWSAVRIPLTYPMTLRYYEALFDGSLGFEQIALFQRPFQFGNLYLSDLAGTLSWGKPPQLPIKNLSVFAAEEAFSVYDHPPVWIFKKTKDFTIENAREILDQVNLSTVVVQGPRDAVWPEGYAQD